MRNTLSNIIIALAFIFCGICGISSCQKPFKIDHTLLIDRDEFYLPKDSGFVDIVVWANEVWTAEFEKEVSWATMEVIDNGSLTGVKIRYTKNEDISRSVYVVFKSGEAEKKAYVAQRAGIVSPMFVFEKDIISLLKVGHTLIVPFQTNLGNEDLAKIETEIKFVTEGDPGGWLTDFHLEGYTAVCTVADNLTGLDRSAIINVEIPGAYPGEGAGSSITVNQSKDGAQVEFTTGDQTVSGLSNKVAFGYKINFDPDLYKIYTLNYGFADGQGIAVDWVKNVELTGSELSGLTKVNENDPRTATAFIEIMMGAQSISKVSASLTQETADVELTDGQSGEQQDKDDPEDF